MTIDPMARLDAGRAAAKAGRYAEALAEYQWFHDESLAIDPAVYGVRLSYALSDWAKLGESYPEALDALRSVRDRKVQDLLRGCGGPGQYGRRSWFHDVTSINHYLGEDDRNYPLFRQLLELDEAVARECGDLALTYLVAAEDFELAGRFVPESKASVQGAARRLNEGVRRLQARPGPTDSRESIKFAMMFGGEAQLYAEHVELHRTVMSHTERRAESDELREFALSLVEDDSIREKTRLLLS
ncbi:MAG: hypothetical protein NXI31_22055 [bacterium]|nr:hypothetical protein [bacterium]